MSRMSRKRQLGQTGAGRRGGALLMVLWLSAALSAIAFSVALTVRSELGRATTTTEAPARPLPGVRGGGAGG